MYNTVLEYGTDFTNRPLGIGGGRPSPAPKIQRSLGPKALLTTPLNPSLYPLFLIPSFCRFRGGASAVRPRITNPKTH